MENLNTIPTAEEFLKQVSPNDEFGLRLDLGNSKKHIYEIMCRFDKLHVQAALKEAFLNSEMRVSENDTNEYPSFVSNYDDGYVTITVSKDSILNAYPVTLIK